MSEQTGNNFFLFFNQTQFLESAYISMAYSVILTETKIYMTNVPTFKVDYKLREPIE